MNTSYISRSIYYYNAITYCRDSKGELKISKRTNNFLKDVFSKIIKMQYHMLKRMEN